MPRPADAVPAEGRWVSVDPERLAGWLSRFAERHGPAECVPGPTEVLFTAADGAVAACRVPFPPLGVDPDAPDGGLVAHALAERRVGVLLVRLGGYAAGVFAGPRLVASKVGSRQVHGRSAAGGWSQQRFARRREGQVRAALAAAADVAVGTLLPALPGLAALIAGGDRRAVETVLADPRLARLRPLLAEPHLEVPDPRLRVLEQAAKQFRAVRIKVLEPAPAAPAG
ncbi:MAG: hypothetical protein V7637_1396 [Mycobacteriales bacterium]|jgi:hypothetical protein